MEDEGGRRRRWREQLNEKKKNVLRHEVLVRGRGAEGEWGEREGGVVDGKHEYGGQVAEAAPVRGARILSGGRGEESGQSGP